MESQIVKVNGKKTRIFVQPVEPVKEEKVVKKKEPAKDVKNKK